MYSNKPLQLEVVAEYVLCGARRVAVRYQLLHALYEAGLLVFGQVRRIQLNKFLIKRCH